MVAPRDERPSEKTRTRSPARFAVLARTPIALSHRDIVNLLMRHFTRDDDTAEDIALELEVNGAAIFGVYSYDVAETRLMQATSEAFLQGVSLRLDLLRA